MNPWDYLSPDTLENRHPLISDVIKTGATYPERVPSIKEVSQLQKRVIDGLVRLYPSLAEPQSPKFSRGAVCTSYGALFKGILSLPERDRVQLLRFYLANQLTPRLG